MAEDWNVLGEELETCSIRPMTGFYRTGCCETGAEDVGAHVVCAELTEEFLAFSTARGNDPQHDQDALEYMSLEQLKRHALDLA